MTQQTRLFNGIGLGQEFWTNMDIAGTFASDNTYIVLALRIWLWFRGNNALLMYQLAAHQMYIQFTVGDKPQFNGQCWYKKCPLAA